MDTMGTMITEILKVFSSIATNVEDVLSIYINNTILLFLLGLMFSGAIFSFAQRLIHRR